MDFSNPAEMRMWRGLLRTARFLQPLLRRLGVDLSKVDLDEMIATLDTLTDIRDSFNEVFAPLGWIAHDWVNVDAAQEALSLARAGDLPSAERRMVDAYAPEHVESFLLWMQRLRCFRKRYDLAWLALDDYRAGRFHACVPVVLALLDGMGQELTGAGFLRQGVRFARADSFLEIGPGLATLIRAMTQSRGGTTEEQISLPFRHGILHGVDLGYANRMVAAKTWAALIAAGSYARSIENPKPKVEDVGMFEAIRQLGETQRRGKELERAMEDWAPRDPATTLAGLRGAGPERHSAEAVAHALFAAWVSGNFGQMARCSADRLRMGVNHLAGRIRQNINGRPSGFAIIRVEDDGPGATQVEAEFNWTDAPSSTTELRFCYYLEEEWMPRTLPGGEWLAVSLWPLEALHLQNRAVAD